MYRATDSKVPYMDVIFEIMQSFRTNLQIMAEGMAAIQEAAEVYCIGLHDYAYLFCIQA